MSTWEENRLKTVQLENGLQLELIGCTRQIASDRLAVRLYARIDIPVEKHWFASKEEAMFLDLSDVLGPAVLFEKREERSFVDAKDRDAVLEALTESVLTSAARYYGHADFPARFLLRTYRERVASVPPGEGN